MAMYFMLKSPCCAYTWCRLSGRCRLAHHSGKQLQKHQAAHVQQQDGLWQQVLLDGLLDHYSCHSSTKCSVCGEKCNASIQYAPALVQNIMCKLLCLSKASSSEVLSRFGGRLSLHFSATTAEQTGQFAAWLARHGSLVGQLQLSIDRWQELPLFAPSAPVLIANHLNIAAARRTLPTSAQSLITCPVLQYSVPWPGSAA
jgi:hypothetical protein